MAIDVQFGNTVSLAKSSVGQGMNLSDARALGARGIASYEGYLQQLEGVQAKNPKSFVLHKQGEQAFPHPAFAFGVLGNESTTKADRLFTLQGLQTIAQDASQPADMRWLAAFTLLSAPQHQVSASDKKALLHTFGTESPKVFMEQASPLMLLFANNMLKMGGGLKPNAAFLLAAVQANNNNSLAIQPEGVDFVDLSLESIEDSPNQSPAIETDLKISPEVTNLQQANQPSLIVEEDDDLAAQMGFEIVDGPSLMDAEAFSQDAHKAGLGNQLAASGLFSNWGDTMWWLLSGVGGAISSAASSVVGGLSSLGSSFSSWWSSTPPEQPGDKK